MRITQAENSMKICPVSYTYLGDLGARVREAPNIGEGAQLKVVGEMGQTYGL